MTSPSLGAGAAPTAMARLQNRWYNHAISQFARDRSRFQIRIPAAPSMPDDASLWSALDRLPTVSLTFDVASIGGASFFDRYRSIADQTGFPMAGLESILDPAQFEAWMVFLAGQQPPPSATDEAKLFAAWAGRYAPGTSAAGMAYLYNRAWDDAARASLQPYRCPDGGQPPFVGGLSELQSQLDAATGSSSLFDSAATSGDVSDTWTGGIDRGLRGLLAGLRSPGIDRTFAESRITVACDVAAYTVWVATPGDWYSSWLLGSAHASADIPPWLPGADPSWEDAFGPGGGCRFATASILAADGVTIALASDGRYDAADRQSIADGAAGGFWPLYAPSGGGVANVVVFPEAGGMELATTIQRGHPVVFGADVLGIADYLGRAPP